LSYSLSRFARDMQENRKAIRNQPDHSMMPDQPGGSIRKLKISSTELSLLYFPSF